MTTLLDLLGSARSPLDLDRVLRRPSLGVFDEALTLAAHGAKADASPAHLGAWAAMSKAAFPQAPPASFIELTGRGSAKTTRLARAATLQVLRPWHDQRAQAGTRIVAILVAPLMRQAAEALRAAIACLDSWAGLGLTYRVVGENSEAPEIHITSPGYKSPRSLVVVAEGDAARSRAICFFGATEGGFFRDLKGTIKAAAPRLAQFHGSSVRIESTPGPADSDLYNMVEGTHIFARHVVARGASFLINPQHMTEARCREMVPDPRDYAQEILAERWGRGGEGFFDADALEAALDTRGDLASRIPIEAQVTCLDLAHTNDASAIVRVGRAATMVSDVSVPVERCIVTHAERIQGSRAAPLRTEDVVRRAVAVAGGGPVTCDRHYSETVSTLLKAAGYREFKILDGDKRGFRGFTGRKHHFASMAAHDQENRFVALRAFAHGQRLHVVDCKDGRALLSELANLEATQLNVGMRFEAKKDDLAKALSLAMSVLPSLPLVHVDGQAGALSRVPAGISFSVDGGTFTPDAPSHWKRILPNGRSVPAEPPPGTPDFRRAVIAAVDSGNFAPGMIRWIESRGFRATPALDIDALFDDRRPLNIPVRGND